MSSPEDRSRAGPYSRYEALKSLKVIPWGCLGQFQSSLQNCTWFRVAIFLHEKCKIYRLPSWRHTENLTSAGYLTCS